MIDLRLNYPRIDFQYKLLQTDLAIESQKLNLSSLEHETNLRTTVAGWLSKGDFNVYPNQITSVCGGNHALYTISIATKLAGANVVVDPLTYNGFVKLALLLRIKLIVCPVDNNGFEPDHLRSLCKDIRIRALYLIPTMHNPLAFRMSTQRRHSIKEIAREFGVLIIEDDAYAFLANDGPDSFMHIAPERTFSAHSFTKIVDPSIKMGFLVSPPEWTAEISEIVKITSGGPSRIFECLALKWIQNGALSFLASEKSELAVSRLRLVHEVLSNFRYISQETGFHIWLPIDNSLDIRRIVTGARRDGVDILSSLDCQVGTSCKMKGLRIAFGNVNSGNELVRGLEVVARMVLR